MASIWAASLTSTGSWSQSSRTYCFVNQSGKASLDLTVGVLVTTNLLQIKQELEQIRYSANYGRSLRSKSTDSKKVVFCRLALEYLLSSPLLYFVGSIVSVKSWPDRAEDRDVAYIGMHRRVLNSLRLKRESRIDLSIADHGVTPIEMLRSELGRLPPWNPAVSLRHPRDEVGMQLAGHFAGLIRYERSATRASATRLTILRDARALLGVERLDAQALANHSKFRVQVLEIQ